MISIDFEPEVPVIVGAFYYLADDVRTKSLREPLKRSIKEVVAPAFRDNFQAEGRPAWEPLADATWERKKGPGILHETGKLRRYAGQLQIWDIDGIRGEATIKDLNDFDIGYGYVHQEGWGPIPARPWAEITPDDIDKIQDIFGRWVDEKIALRMAVI